VVIAPRPRDPPPGPLSMTAPRTLLIDRQALFLAALRRLLSSPPLSADVAVSTQSTDAVEIVLKTRPDLVVCDLMAQPVSGPDLASILADQGLDVRVILLADREDEAALVGSLLCGATGFFTKDTPVEEFVEGVQAVLKGYYTLGRNLLHLALAKLGSQAENRPRPVSQLSPTEYGILTLIGQAQSVRSIASARGISQKTVRNHLGNIYRKLQLRNRSEAILWAVRNGLTPQEVG
jgi:DNA-binding NarL/FixJ family response regulator